MTPFSVGVTGSRNGLTEQQEEMLDQLAYYLHDTEWHFGDCVGVDNQVAHYVYDHREDFVSTKLIGHPPVKQDLRANFKFYDYTWPEKPYLLRNLDIVKCSDLIFAFPNGKSLGTAYTIEAAVRRGKMVRVIKSNGIQTVYNDRTPF